MSAQASHDEVLNAGLNLAMEWGEDWLKPIQDRLGLLYPAMSQAERDEANSTCQAAMKFGHGSVYELASASGKDTKASDFERIMKHRYSWVDSRNLARLFNQGMYYAWKDMGF